MKDWYKLRGVEYSTNFYFFIENQIFTSKSGRTTSFNSLLESYCFYKIDSYKSNGGLDNIDREQILKTIHSNLLKGNYGKGILIN